MGELRFRPRHPPAVRGGFQQGQRGRFPKRLEFIDGNMEVAERGGMRVLRVSSRPGKFAIKLAEPLPERFTLEFDATTEYAGDYVILRFNDKATEDVRFRLHDGEGQGGVFGGTKQSLGFTSRPITPKEVFRGRLMADGRPTSSSRS
jgi:hypothetical protein